jgi:hypothetical protein
MKLLAAANQWLKAMYDNPDKYGVPYEWTLTPIAIAEGPMPPNQAEIEHAQDVLKFCFQERATLLDQLNLLNWWSRHQDHYDWTGAATAQQIADSVRATQIDLDTVASCASAAIDDPAHAVMPAGYAATQSPPRTYPSSLPLPKGPKALPGVSPGPPEMVTVPNMIGQDSDERSAPLAQLLDTFKVNIVRGETVTGSRVGMIRE